MSIIDIQTAKDYICKYVKYEYALQVCQLYKLLRIIWAMISQNEHHN